ncbi:hypothetical protein Pmar_PMAR007690 [Perkinsus marinus ATCC 50983]|uniref:Uncharacterized protein n=1 Tax=Perkinsus marinus (strain ATCC 50983 / TXsc) TaxID=423536 RepID=C5LMV3_PERM5|nr:hypothetical protein Pmar_PMAR007690 [Perkinsus marinus ATCC 50983]EER01994.1 hypothetical protein Pmar_PMAR007690 [Perkinsus marinus ATCC 50983]|eukprot:XP_002769276.1 hypothetical protein Pmar_PMAR007690 [Perkinsus marinus ATCC 50983]
MMSRPKAPAIVGLSSTHYWDCQEKLEDPFEEGSSYPKTVPSQDERVVRLGNRLWLDDEAPCCCSGDVDCRKEPMSPDKTPSTVASCPSSPDRLERTFLPRSAVQFEPVVQVRFCDRPETCSDIDEPLAEILSSPSSSDPDVTAGSLLSAKNASPETYGEGLSISDWQGVVFETECEIKAFDGHSALREKTYSSVDDLKSMALLMGVAPSRPRYGRVRSETVSDLEEFMEDLRLPRQRGGSAAFCLPHGRVSSSSLHESRMANDDEDNSDSEENILARMEAMGCDMDLQD